jgi:hypothetical protein
MTTSVRRRSIPLECWRATFRASEALALRHGVACVDGEVHQDLLDLAAVGLDLAEVGRDVDLDLDVLADQALDHADEAADDLAEIEDGRYEHLLAAESQELARQGGGALARMLNLLHLCPCLVVEVGMDQKAIAVAEDRGQKVVEVVRHAAGELAHASIFCAWRSCSSSSRSFVTSRTTESRTRRPPITNSWVKISTHTGVPSFRRCSKIPTCHGHSRSTTRPSIKAATWLGARRSFKDRVTNSAAA